MNARSLKNLLESHYDTYHTIEYLRIDPLLCVRKFCAPADIEIVGLIASTLAYGRAEIIIRSVSEIIGRIDRTIVDFTTNASFNEKQRVLRGFKHRFNDGYEIALLLECAGALIRRHGSLGNFFSAGLKKSDATVENALICFSAGFMTEAASLVQTVPKSFSFLLPSPLSGCACKRMNMYLRWMVRNEDGIDFGIWKGVSPSRLLMPIDTHVARIGKTLGLTKRTTPDWTMVSEITARLRTFDRHDPIRYDFSLCRAGMMDFRKEAA